jgi:hypothetical protein
MSEKRHPGITMHKISFGGGFVGLLFAAGSALIFLLGLPSLWYFVALAFGLGVGIALMLRIVNSCLPNRGLPLSILTSGEAPAEIKPNEEKLRFRPLPNLASA